MLDWCDDETALPAEARGVGEVAQVARVFSTLGFREGIDAGEEAAGAVTASSSDQWRESSRAGDSSDSSSVSPTFETVERIASVGSPLGEVRRLSTVVGSVLAPPACFGGVAAIGAERSVLAPPACFGGVVAATGCEGPPGEGGAEPVLLRRRPIWAAFVRGFAQP